MPDDANDLHHVGLITSDMAATIGRYERLGFAFTPLSLPRIVLREGGEPEQLGVGNRTAIFEHNYLEVLATTDPARWATISVEQRGSYDIDRPLARYEGLHVMHFGTDDIEALHARLAKEGVVNSGVRPFQRPVDTAEGPQTMRALTIGFPPAANPEGLVQIAQHLTPELVLQPRYQHHPNGARRLVEITVCADDPAEYARKYTRYTGHPHTTGNGAYTVDLGKSRVRIVRPEGLPAPSLVGFTVTVDDLPAVETLLKTNAVAFTSHADGLTVPASEGAGSTVSFTRDCR
jgi:catechol 2,3-dioxygenase-like lactoylglutathione lyase family enzyme